MSDEFIIIIPGPQFNVIPLPDEEAPDVIVAGVPGPIGPPGPVIENAKIEKRVEFTAASDGILLLAVMEDIVITKVTIQMSGRFWDDADATLSVGTASVPELYMSINDNNLQSDDEFESEPDMEVISGTDIILHIHTGGVVGSGFVSIEYHT